MADVSLRGKCRECAEAAVQADPTLTLVRGWYIDPVWGREEHWWAKRPDGQIVDPTAGQFPVGGVDAWYVEFTGVYPCEECGIEVPEDDLIEGRVCSDVCFGRMVGIPVSEMFRG